MKTILTLSIDKGVLARAKEYCKERKISLSHVVETFLIQFIKENLF